MDFIIEAAVKAVKQLYQTDIEPAAVSIQETRKEFEGQVTIVTFPFTKFSRKGPEQTGTEIGEYLKNELKEVASFNVIKGFLNLSITDEYWIGRLYNNIIADDFAAAKPNGQKVMVEYSSPNTNKPLHLGHIRNNLLGYSVAEILAADGYEVIKTNLVNDRGIHICKSMLAWQKFGNGETPESSGMKGAFTDARTDRIGRFELANNGTLFLDEIANVPMRQQAKLLRVLETGELERVGSSQTRRVDVRVLSATNAKLHDEAASGNFREDLLFRLNTVEINLPALRDRREDIPLLAGYFLNKCKTRYRKQVNGFSPGALQQMMQYPWPGNVRELEHTVERAVLLSRGDEIEPANLAITTSRSATQSFENMSIDEVEALLIRKVLRRCDGNISQASEALGLSRAALYRRIEKYGL